MRYIVLIILGLMIFCNEVILDAYASNAAISCVDDDDDYEDGDEGHAHRKHPARVIKRYSGSSQVQTLCCSIKKIAQDYYVTAQQLWQTTLSNVFILVIGFTIEDRNLLTFDIINLIYEPPRFRSR